MDWALGWPLNFFVGFDPMKIKFLFFAISLAPLLGESAYSAEGFLDGSTEKAHHQVLFDNRLRLQYRFSEAGVITYSEVSVDGEVACIYQKTDARVAGIYFEPKSLATINVGYIDNELFSMSIYCKDTEMDLYWNKKTKSFTERTKGYWINKVTSGDPTLASQLIN